MSTTSVSQECIYGERIDSAIHARCPGWVWDGVDAISCACECHPRLSSDCERGHHQECHQQLVRFVSKYMPVFCDCPCHFRWMRRAVLELRKRVG